MQRPFMLWPLVFVLLFLALGGFSGGIPMLTDPANGGYLQLADILPLLPVSNFILPGLFLLIVMGFFPILLTYALIAHPNWGLGLTLSSNGANPTGLGRRLLSSWQ